MAGRKGTYLLLIVFAGLLLSTERLNAQAGDEFHRSNEAAAAPLPGDCTGFTSMASGGDPSLCLETSVMSKVWISDKTAGNQSGRRISEQSSEMDAIDIRQRVSRLQLDYSLRLSYSHRLLKEAFLQSSDIFIRSENRDQFLYSIDIHPSVIISDRISLNFIYSFIPEQENFSGAGVLDFEVQQTIVDNVNRFSGRALSMSGSYAVPMNEWIRVSMELGFTHMRLNTEEVVRYHPSDPFLRSFRVVRLIISKKGATYTNPFIGMGTEFQLRNLRLGLGYQYHVYQLDQASSSNFTISLGARFHDLF